MFNVNLCMNILIEQRKSPISIETYWALPFYSVGTVI